MIFSRYSFCMFLWSINVIDHLLLKAYLPWTPQHYLFIVYISLLCFTLLRWLYFFTPGQGCSLFIQCHVHVLNFFLFSFPLLLLLPSLQAFSPKCSTHQHSCTLFMFHKTKIKNHWHFCFYPCPHHSPGPATAILQKSSNFPKFFFIKKIFLRLVP